jgi:LysR family transcriptional regulator, hydrogen peroxide-inducible genes activator
VKFAPHPVTLRQLQYLVAVFEFNSFRKAAEECHVAQPSLSAQVALAESALGIQLFERDRRKVIATTAGAAFLEQARALLREADSLEEAARRLHNPFEGTVRIGVIPTAGPYLLPEVAPALLARFPKLGVRWVEEKTPVLNELLAHASIDCAILVLDATTEKLPHHVIGVDEFLLAADASNALVSGKRSVHAEELKGEQVLLLDDGHCFREQALSFCSAAGAEEQAYRATSLATLVQMTASGTGVTLLPALSIRVENRHQLLRLRHFSPNPPSRTLALVWRKNSALGLLLETLGEALAAAYRDALARGAFGTAESASNN